jgi:pilus assembly protein CpaE
MSVVFQIFYRSPEQGDYLKQVVQSSGAGKLASAHDLQHLPPPGEDGADVILLEYQENNPELDRWLENTVANPKSPAVFLFSPQITTDLLWKALRLGAKECFTYPIDQEEFRGAVNRVLSRALKVLGKDRAPRIISFVGCKGGVGTTFLTANVACCLAREHRGQVLLIDLDLRYGQLVHYFDLLPQHTLSDAVSHHEEMDTAYLQGILHPYRKHLQILPAPARLEEGEAVGPDHVEQLLANAKKLPGCRWVLIDAGSQFHEVTLKAVELSDELVLVTTPSVPALSNAKKLLELLRLLGLEGLHTQLWLNAWQKDEDLSLEEVAKFLGRETTGTIRYQPGDVARSINEGRPLVETAPRHPVCQDLRAMVAKLLGEEKVPQNSNGLGWGLLKRLRRKR